MKAESKMQGKKLDVLQFISPFTACIRQRWARLLLFAFSVYLLFDAYSAFRAVNAYGIAEFQTFRLDITEPAGRTNASALTAGMQIVVALLKDGCVALASNLTLMANSKGYAEPILSLPSPMAVNGFSVTVQRGWNSNAVAGFILRGSNDGGSTWAVAGASAYRFVPSGVRFLLNGGGAAADATYDFRPPWPLYEESAVDSILLALGCASAALCGALNRHDLGKTMFVWYCGILAVNAFVAGAGYLCLGLPLQSFSPLVASAVYLLFQASLVGAEKFCFDSLRLLSIASLASRVVSDCNIFHDCDNLSAEPPVKSAFFALAGFGFIFIRDVFLFSALGAVRADRARYDAEWERLASEPASRAPLRQLEALAALVVEDAAALHARQLNRRRADAEPKGDEGKGGRWLACCWRRRRSGKAHSEDYGMPKTVAGKADVAAPVVSLDQLYSQAMGVVHRLHVKCIEWAAASRGTVENSEEEADYAKDAVSLPGPMERWMRLRYIKKPSRAIEKAMVCYLDDVSLLLDVCRARIVFEEVADLLACLEIVRSDAATVKVVRIKNCLSDGYDSWLTAGFRAVVLNVRFDTDETRYFGVENHVCEVQLVLKRFLKIKSEGELREQHFRYLNFRAVRMFARNFRKHREARHAVWPEPDAGSESPGGVDLECGDDTFIHEDQVYPLDAEGEVADSEDAAAAAQLPLPVTSRTANLCSDGDRVRLMYLIYVRSVLTAGGVLDHQASQVEKAFEQSSAGSVWFTSKPMAAAATKQIFQVFQLLLASFFLYRGIESLSTVLQAGEFQATMLRFSVYELRSTALPPNATSIGAFGVLRDGCKLPTQSAWTPTPSGLVVRLDRQVTANGYYFATAQDGTGAADPVRWLVEASADNGSSWRPVGASAWRINWNGGVDVCPQLGYPTPAGRGLEVRFDLRETWPMIVRSCVDGFEWAFGMTCGVIAGVVGLEDHVRTIFATCVTSGLLFLFVAAAGFHAAGDLRGAGSVWLEVCPQAVFAVGIILFEARIVSVFFLYSLIFLAALVINDRGVYGVGWDATLRDIGPSPPTGTFFFACIVINFRRRVLAHARRLVLADKAHYDSIWEEAGRMPGAQRSLQDLQEEVRRLTAARRAGPPRQYNRLPGSDGDDNLGVPGTLDLERPVNSLDQLFVQAVCLHPILLAKVKTWAAASEGCFPMAGGGSFVKFVDGSKQPLQQMKYGKVKTVSRAIEKVFRSFGQDVSMLVDLCRQSIVFEAVADMVTCLKVIGADADVEIMRIKNRFDPGYDSTASAGYRDVALNLRIVSDETKGLGLETHVCELQLLLRPIAELKSDAGHKRYVTFRNLRGE